MNSLKTQAQATSTPLRSPRWLLQLNLIFSFFLLGPGCALTYKHGSTRQNDSSNKDSGSAELTSSSTDTTMKSQASPYPSVTDRTLPTSPDSRPTTSANSSPKQSSPTVSPTASTAPSATSSSEAPSQAAPAQVASNNEELTALCDQGLRKFKGKFDDSLLTKACKKAKQLTDCESVKKVPIYHIDYPGSHSSNQKILVFSLIHGDEKPAGSVGRLWLERLENIDPRNSWRIVPVLNPDGVLLNTRTNANKVDINRNFPTKDWDTKAHIYWKKDGNGSPRRFPGSVAASEPETKCALAHIEQFKPDMIVSIHTPLKVLDYDGPKISPPKYDYLPWKSLGHYPGSLGRYMWHERQIPVLTMELKEDLPSSQQPLLQLQDIIGFLVSLEFTKKKLEASR